jgi:hypothetical protein
VGSGVRSCLWWCQFKVCACAALIRCLQPAYWAVQPSRQQVFAHITLLVACAVIMYRCNKVCALSHAACTARTIQYDFSAGAAGLLSNDARVLHTAHSSTVISCRVFPGQVSHCYSLLLLLVPLHDILICQLAPENVQCTAHCDVDTPLASSSNTLQIRLCGRESKQAGANSSSSGSIVGWTELRTCSGN